MALSLAKIAKDMGLKEHFNDEYVLLRKAYKLIPDGTSHKDLIEIKQVLFSNDANVKDKERMDKVEIWEVLVMLSGNEISLKEAHTQICYLLGVKEHFKDE
jgi:hypothetical protein